MVDDLISLMLEKSNQRNHADKNQIEIVILVPDAVVSMLIGKEGRNLKKMTGQSRASIRVEHKQNKIVNL